MPIKRYFTPRWLRVAAVAAAGLSVAWSVATSAGETGELMKAITYHVYGSPDVLRIEETAKPVPGDNQVLIKVRAAAANPLDWHTMRGTPYFIRLIDTGLFKPKDTRLGQDVLGVVEAVGKNVTKFKPGDEVFGAAGGAFAEYARTSEKNIVLKPAALTFEQAAAVPVAALTALQGLRDKGRIQPGQKILINGASGGVGTFAVQIAKSFGAEVTGVCSTRNADMVRALGADHVVDYIKEDFTQSAERYDLILDNVGNRPLSDIRRVLAPKGIYVLVGGGGPDDGRWLGPLVGVIKTLLVSPFVSQDLTFFVAAINTDDLTTLNALMETGKVTPILDRTYPLQETAAAIRYLEQGRARGKVVIVVNHDDAAPSR